MIYAGIGSRKTPADVLAVMMKMAYDLAAKGWILRSGGAPGADAAFERGAGSAPKEIFIPWRGFEGRTEGIVLSGNVLDRALLLASVVHPNWGACSVPERLIHARDVPQIWGADLETPADVVVCWAPPTADGSVRGGTRTAVEIARAAGIPVINLATAGGLEEARRYFASD